MQNIVVLAGGLGNQLFQLAFGRWLELYSEWETRYLVGRPNTFKELAALGPLGEDFRKRAVIRGGTQAAPTYRMLDEGQSGEALAIPERTVWRLPSRKFPAPRAQSDPLDRSRPALWIGHWGQKEYVDVLLPALATAIENATRPEVPPFIGVHVRRGDMLKTPMAVPGHWFEAALRKLRGSLDATTVGLSARIWSDDLEWCRDNLDIAAPDDFAHPGRPVEHLAQLSNAAALVISRSTFSWWAAAIASARSSRVVRVVFPDPWPLARRIQPGPESAPPWVPLEIYRGAS
jgi:Glycosyl transferase family 11